MLIYRLERKPGRIVFGLFRQTLLQRNRVMKIKSFRQLSVLMAAVVFVGVSTTLVVTGALAEMTQEEIDALMVELEAEGDAMAGGGGTPDGLTPAVEDICTKWGFSGKVNGLCNAYCEAMDCDHEAPQASEQACTRVFNKIIGELGDTPFPTCDDSDDDGHR